MKTLMQIDISSPYEYDPMSPYEVESMLNPFKGLAFPLGIVRQMLAVEDTFVIMFLS